MEQIENKYDALVLALCLGITDPTEEKSKEANYLAEILACTMTTEEVERCKKEARAAVVMIQKSVLDIN